MDEKQCATCKNIFPIGIFHKLKTTRGEKVYFSYSSYCPTCKAIKAKESRDKHKEKINERRRTAYPENKDRLSLGRKLSYLKKIEYYRTKSKEYSAKHKEQKREYRKVYYNTNKEKIFLRIKDYRERNKETVKRWRLEKAKDPHFKLRKRLSNQIRRKLANVDVKKNNTTMASTGCTIAFLKNYIELKFTKEMSWKKFNAGEIHVDHIIPCAMFDLTDPEQQKQCFHYTNLQPLWAKDNMSKGAKILDISTSQLKIAI